MSLRVTLEPEGIALAPGETSTVQATVVNCSDVVEHYRVSLLGLPPGQTLEVSPPLCKLQPGESGTIAVRIGLSAEHPPPAATPVLGVLVASPYRTEAAYCAELRCQIRPAPELTLSVEPPQAQGGRRVSYEARIGNDGNTMLDVALSAADPERRVRVELEPVQLRLGPGQVGYARVRARARVPLSGSEARRRITVTAAAGGRTRDCVVTMAQRPLFAGGFLRVLAGISALTVMSGAIVGAALVGTRALRGHGSAAGSSTPVASSAATARGTGVPTPASSTGSPSAGQSGATAATTSTAGTGSPTGSKPPAGATVVDLTQQPLGQPRSPRVIAPNAYPGLTLTALPDTQRAECAAAGTSVAWDLLADPPVGGFVSTGIVQQQTDGPHGLCMDLTLQIQWATPVHQVSVDLVGLTQLPTQASLTYTMSAPQSGASSVTAVQLVGYAQHTTLTLNDASGNGIRQVAISGSPPRSGLIVAVTKVTYR